MLEEWKSKSLCLLRYILQLQRKVYFPYVAMRLNPGAFALADFLNSAREFRKSPGSASRDGDTRGIGAFQKSSVIGPLRGSFFLENGTLRDTREKNPEIGSKNVTDD